jgi:hypothetical protein
MPSGTLLDEESWCIEKQISISLGVFFWQNKRPMYGIRQIAALPHHNSLARLAKKLIVVVQQSLNGTTALLPVELQLCIEL